MNKEEIEKLFEEKKIDKLLYDEMLKEAEIEGDAKE